MSDCKRIELGDEANMWDAESMTRPVEAVGAREIDRPDASTMRDKVSRCSGKASRLVARTRRLTPMQSTLGLRSEFVGEVELVEYLAEKKHTGHDLCRKHGDRAYVAHGDGDR